MSFAFLWNWIGGDEHITVQLNEFSNGRTIDEIERELLLNMERMIDDRINVRINESFRTYRNNDNLNSTIEAFKQKLNTNEAETNIILKRFDNKFKEQEKKQQELQNKILAVEQYIKTSDDSIKIDEEYILDIVKKEIEKIDLSDIEVDESRIEKKITERIIHAVGNEFSRYNNKINDAYVKIYELQNVHIQDQKNLSILNFELEKEKKKNDKLEADLKRDEQEIAELFNMVKDMQNVISELTLQNHSISKGSNDTEVISAENIEEKKVLYSSEKQNYGVILNQFIRNTDELKRKAQNIYGNSQNGEMIRKLIDKCKQKFVKLVDKNNTNDYEVEKIVSETAKIIKQTIAKALSQSEFKPYVDEYLQKCGIRKINWQVGKKLEESDYEYIGETVLYDPVESKDEDETITEIVQDSYVIDYEEDGNIYEKLISGIYHIGRYGK